MKIAIGMFMMSTLCVNIASSAMQLTIEDCRNNPNYAKLRSCVLALYYPDRLKQLSLKYLSTNLLEVTKAEPIDRSVVSFGTLSQTSQSFSICSVLFKIFLLLTHVEDLETQKLVEVFLDPTSKAQTTFTASCDNYSLLQNICTNQFQLRKVAVFTGDFSVEERVVRYPIDCISKWW